MKLGDFLNTLAQKVGAQNDPALISILSNADLANKDLADDFANTLNSQLMSLEGAKNNAAVKAHYHSQALNGVDAEIINLLSESGFDESIIEQFKGEKNTYNKLRGLKDKIKELREKKSDEPDSGKKAEYQKTINDLNAKIAQMQEAEKTEIANLKSQHENQLTDMFVRQSLLSHNYANKDLKPEINAITAKTIIEQALAEKGAVISRNGSQLVLKQKDNPEMDFLIDHKQIGYNDFVTKVLTDNKMLAVSGGKAPSKTPGFDPNPNNSAVSDAIAESMADLKTE